MKQDFHKKIFLDCLEDRELRRGKLSLSLKGFKITSHSTFELERSASSIHSLRSKTKCSPLTLCVGVSLPYHFHSGLGVFTKPCIKCPSGISSVRTRSEAICRHRDQLEDTSVSNDSNVIHHLMINLY